MTTTDDAHHPPTSPTLLAGARALDDAAWKRLVDRYAPLVYHWCRRAGVTEADAADVSQEVFHAVSRKLGEFESRHSVGSFRGWLRTITVNRVRDRVRRRERRPQLLLGSVAEGIVNRTAADLESETAATSDEAERALILRAAVDRVRDEIKAETWQAFWRTAVDGRNASEVAAELGLSPGAVRVAKFRVVRRLRSELES